MKQIQTDNDLSLDELDFIEIFLTLSPGHIYWKNLKGEFQGCNQLQAVDAGLASNKDEANKAKVLQFQNESYQSALKEQEKFASIVGQMLHDIQSPLASLRMTVESTNEIPEQKRITLRTSATNIIDITSNLLSSFSKDESLVTENNKRQTVLVSAILSEVISDRRYKYKDMLIEFEYKLNQLNAFLFIKVEPSSLKRSISNLINNAVDALPNSRGKIELNLRANEEWVYISILDDGHGIPEEVLTKIKNKIAVTANKEDGHGIGLTQVRGMLERNHGEFDIISSQHKESHGTTITLKFPRAETPDWVIEEISLTKNNTIIILDDDKSIHGAWDSRFEYLLEKEPNIRIKHFSIGKEVIEFVVNLPDTEKDNICLLSDYELINQDLNGLEIIEQCKIKRSILVTSHHADSAISKQAIENSIKILPKDIVYAVPFKIIQDKDQQQVNVHMVFIDDDKTIMQTLVAEYYNHLIVDQYSNPFEFLNEVDKYPHDTKLIFDNYYYADDGSTLNIDGITMASRLHEKGYTKLFLLSGEEFSVPEYLTLILKSDKERIRNLDKL